MQPILVLSSHAEGLVYINGRMAGELSPAVPIITPITPEGRVYIELSPFGRRYRAAAYRFDMRGGSLAAESLSDTLHALLWPGSVLEISLMPIAAVPKESEYSQIDGIPAAILRGDSTLLRIGSQSVALPEGASLPAAHIALNGCELYTGSTGSGEYTVAFASSDLAPAGIITADSIRTENGSIYIMTALNDTANHARYSEYAVSESGFELISEDIKWAPTGRRHPSNAEEAALAAMEALLLGRHAEAAEYMSGVISLTSAAADAVVPMKYAPPNVEPAIGLVNRINDRTAQVTPLHYRAAKGADGKWKVTDFHK